MEELKAIARFIAQSYPQAKKIVEVGVGRVPEVAVELSKLLPSCEVVVTDVSEPPPLPPNVKFARDDVTSPDPRVYKGAELIYSIRPPPELQPHLKRLAQRVKVDLLIKPLAGESVLLKGAKLINFEGASFYLRKFENSKNREGAVVKRNNYRSSK